MTTLALAFVVALFFPLVASAHSTGAGAQAFLSGFIHPFIVSQHLLLLVGLSVLIAQRKRASLKTHIAYAGIGLIPGLAIAEMWSSSVVTPLLFIILAAVIGIVVASEFSIPAVFDLGVLIIATFLIGLDSGQESVVWYEVAFALLGIVVSIYAILFDVPYYLNLYRAPWTNIGLRIIGSWVAAISIILFAFYARGIM